MGARLVEVDETALVDLCRLVEGILDYGLEDELLGYTTFRAVPQPHVNALRGALAEVRCHAVAAPA